MASATLTLFVGALVLFVLYCVKTYTYWRRHKIPTPGGSIPFLGHMWPVYTVTKNATDHFESLYNQSKNYSMFGIYDMFTPALVIREPQLIKTVLQSNFSNFHKNGVDISPKKDRLLALNPFFAQGEAWSTGRKRLTFAFSNAKLKTLFLGVMEVAKKQEAFLDKHLKSKNKYECELKHFFGRFTAESVANAGLGVEGYSYEDNPPPNAFHTIGQNMFTTSFINAFVTTIAFLKSNLIIFLGIPFLPKEIEMFFRDVVHENLDIRLKDPTGRNDFFQLMIEMEKSEGKGVINEEAIVAHSLSLFMDGFETSRLTLSFVVYQLAIHPEVQEKLRDEIKSIIAKNNGEMTFEGLKDLKYMEQVISESQRHNAAVAFLKKVCMEAYELIGSDGLTVKMKPGMQVLVPMTALHNDPQYWSDPKVFDPDRFSDERKQDIEKMSFIPFGEGPRMCVGMRMAMLMMKCCLVSLLNNYRIELSPKTTVPLKFSKYHFLSQPTGFWAYISKLLLLQCISRWLSSAIACIAHTESAMASATLTLLVGALVLFVLYCVKTYTYWKRRKIPIPAGSIPFLGHMWPVYTVTRNFTDYFHSLYNQSKKYSMFGIYDMFTPTLVIREPQLIKTVLQSNFSNFHKNGFEVSPKKDRLLALNPFFASGETWSTGRKRLTLAFSNAKLKTLFLGVMGVAKKQEAFLDKHLKSENKYECELKHFFGRFTAESVANAGLGVEGYSYEDNPPPNAFHTIGQNVFNASLINAFLTTLAFLKSNLMNFLGIPILSKEMEMFFRGVVHENLDIRLKDPTARNDFFQLMIEMEQSEDKSGINEEAIVAHTLSLFFDGFETSRLTLAFVAYQLAVHPDVQDKLRDEIKSIIAKNNGELTFEGLKDLKYMEQVISESQRHNSALVFMKKVCTEAYELTGSDGLSVKMTPGMQVIVPISALHHDPQYFSDPNVFDPDRFSDERKQDIEKMSFIPFGEGPRMCVGMRMAMLMMKCCLVSLLNNYKIELSPKTTVPLKFSKYHFLSEPVNGVWAYLSKL
ncbi:uncharacterized protein LOC143207240 [Lasioglossum baleicum]|uniref:uncharacterized protein LOC143207240 n=1 Tax=Lasioglossum baleicum TaxID=434251 RepID=UPI003FCC5FF2